MQVSSVVKGEFFPLNIVFITNPNPYTAAANYCPLITTGLLLLHSDHHLSTLRFILQRLSGDGEAFICGSGHIIKRFPSPHAVYIQPNGCKTNQNLGHPYCAAVKCIPTFRNLTHNTYVVFPSILLLKGVKRRGDATSV